MPRALTIPGPGRFSLVERDRRTPGPLEVRLDVGVATICHTDTYLYSGVHFSDLPYPIIPGHEFSGTVVEVGANVAELQAGDRVAVRTLLGCGACQRCHAGDLGRCTDLRQLGTHGEGGWQETVVIPATAARRPPREMSLLDLALTEPSANAHAAVRRSQLAGGETVAIVGPGPIGLLALQYARLRLPGRTIVVGRHASDDRLELARRLGADAVVGGTPEHVTRSVREMTDGRGADVVLQCAGTIAATRIALDIAADQGRIAIEGVSGTRETVQISPDDILERELTIVGVRGWTARDFDSVLDINSRGQIELAPIVTHQFDLGAYERAWAAATERTSGAVKVAFRMNTDER